MNKQCTECNNTKLATEFRLDPKGKLGRRSICKACEKRIRQIGVELKKKRERDTVETRRCDKCQVDKPVSEFEESIVINDKQSRQQLSRRRRPNFTCHACMRINSREQRSLRRNPVQPVQRVPILTRPIQGVVVPRAPIIRGVFGQVKIIPFGDEVYGFGSAERKLAEVLDQLVGTFPINGTIELEYMMKNTKGVIFSLYTELSQRITSANVERVKKSLIDDATASITEQYIEPQSGLTFAGLRKISFIYKLAIMSGGGSYVELPKKVRDTKACINIQNKRDNKCFLWCLIAFFLKSEKKESNPSKLFIYNKKEHTDKIIMSDINYPVAVNDIPKIEEMNNISINVYELHEILSIIEGEKIVTYPISLIYPLDIEDRRSKVENRHINLLLYKGHYIYIKSIQRLFSSCVTGSHSAYVCEWCGSSILTSKTSLTNHEEKCKYKYQNQKYILPQNTVLKFNNHNKSIIIPFIIYGDFESYFESSNKEDTNKIVYEKVHKAMGFCIKTICRSNSNYNNNVLYIGENTENMFIDNLVNEIKRIENILSNVIPIIMDDDDNVNFLESDKCFICKELLNGDKVRDHDPINGKYRGASHSGCNLKYTKRKFMVPVVFHNLEG